MWISYSWRNTFFWSKKSDITSQVYLFFFWKSFRKQTKTLEDQGQKQISALEEHEKQLIKSISEKDSLELLKLKYIFDELVNEKRFEINELSDGIDFYYFTYYYTG